MSPYSHGVIFYIHNNSIGFTQCMVFVQYVKQQLACNLFLMNISM